MIKIFTDQAHLQKINELISSEDRLIEWIILKDSSQLNEFPIDPAIIVHKNGFDLSLDWQNKRAPYLFPHHIDFEANNFLASIYFLLGNFEKTYKLLETSPALLKEVDCYMRLSNGIETNEKDLSIDTLSTYDEYRLLHNAAILLYYTNPNAPHEKISYYFKEAINTAPNEELEIFTSKFYISYLMDQGEFEHAEVILLSKLNLMSNNSLALTELKALQNKINLKKIVVPYNQELIKQLKDQIWEVLQEYENQERLIEAGMLLEDASFLANISESFAESLGYISRAIEIFKNENLKELYYQAEWKKGNLLYTWAKKGQAQFFNAAIQSYKTALLYFTKFEFPEIYAEIQQFLGVIYSEIPCEVKKKPIWAAFSASAFQEALDIFKKERFPYDYAATCNAYANALILYPDAKKSNNIEKALDLYKQALEIRTAQNYPIERALTLLNYIEASWYANANEEKLHNIRIKDMTEKAEEVLALSNDEAIKSEAKAHLAKIDTLKQVLN